MNERGDGEPQLPTILPDGQEIFFDNKYQRLLAERLVLTNEESPIDFMDLGGNIFGSRFSVESHGKALGALIEFTNEQLAPKNWRITNNSLEVDEQKLWVAPVTVDDGEKLTPLEDSNLSDLNIEEDDVVVDKNVSLVVIEKTQSGIAEFVEDFSRTFMDKLSEIDRANIQEAMFRDPKRVKAEIDEVTKTVTKFKKGEFQTPNSSQLLEGRVSDKIDLVGERLKGLLALSLVDPNNKTVRSKFGWGKELNEMMLFSGGGEAGREAVFEAIFNLNGVERALVLSQMSMTKRYEILLIGLDQINEREMAGFISNATYKFEKTADTEELEEIVSGIVARDNLDGFEVGKVIDAIEEHYPHTTHLIYRRLINAARQADFVHDLMEFFSSNQMTAQWTTKLEDGFGEEPVFIKYNRRV